MRSGGQETLLPQGTRPDLFVARREKPAPQRRRKETESQPQTLVIYAGGSERRAKFAEWAFPKPQFTVISRSGGTEDETRPVVTIMKRKINVAYATVMGEGIVKPSDSTIVIAADIKTRVGTSRISRSKPETPEETRRMLEFMSEHAYPYFTVEVGSGVKVDNGNPDMTHNMIAFLLDRETIKKLATPEGFKAYLRDIEIYDVLPGGGNNKVTEIAGGLSIPALIHDGGILEINFKNGEDTTSSVSHKSVKRALCHTGVGFSLDLLKKVQPNIERYMETWPYLEHATARCLEEVFPSVA